MVVYNKINNPHTPRAFGKMTICVQVTCLRGLKAGMKCCKGVPFQCAAGCPATVTVHSVPSLVLNLVK